MSTVERQATAVDTALAALKFRLEGTTALIMHNIRLANPLDNIVREMKKITSKKAKDKTEADQELLYWLEFQGGLYYDARIGPYIPGRVMHACIQEAARSQRKGSTIDRSLLVVESKIPLEYDGPRDPKGMWDARSPDGTSTFVDIRGMKPTGRGVCQRCRPIFHPPWAVEFTLEFDENDLNPEKVIEFVRYAGSKTGMLDDRPQGGRFEVRVLNG